MLFFQVSDLHMSDDLSSEGDSFRYGQEGHSLEIAGRLRNALRRIAAKRGVADEYYLVVAGDVSRTGDSKEFAVFRDYLVRTDWPCLGRSDTHCCFTPGNHDHWNGIDRWPRVPAYNSNIFTRDFPATPWVQRFPSTQEPFDLEIFGVDSNSGLRHRKTNPTAKGDISWIEFCKLERLLKSSVHAAQNRNGKRIVRAIASHHSFTRGSWWNPFDAYPLSRSSRTKLLEIAAKYDVTAILTGHTHWFNMKRYFKRVRRWNEQVETWRPVYEMRSPTTIQAGRKIDLRNGFLAHEISLEADTGIVTWNPTLYLYRTDQFVPSPKRVLKRFGKIPAL